ncbi:iron-containing alcohol dehydrogenase [Paenibacillus lautus]|uniref:iron-containing alcohol dehydrogenase n=1 Tax=Paenibacillus lautus TaxID=1401 RepID=UPI0010D806D6|nr:iron-containing alcohol dehydrogenase [Actinobacillus pleuropneumoniae]
MDFWEVVHSFKIPYGLANALYLPYVIDFNKKANSKRYADIARTLCLNGNTDDQLVDSLTDLLRSLNKTLNLPLTLQEVGVNQADFEKQMDQMAAGAVEDPCTRSNPRELSVEQMKQIYIAAFKARKSTFNSSIKTVTALDFVCFVHAGRFYCLEAAF